MSFNSCLGVLLPEDGPPDYEWYGLDQTPAFQRGELPRVEVGKVNSDGHHEHTALMALGATDRLATVGEGLVKEGGAQAVIWACTSGSFIGGLEWATRQSKELEKILGVPVTSTVLAFKDAISVLGYRHVDILSPYPEDVTQQLVEFLQEGGVTVGHVKALDCPYAADSHQLNVLEEVRAFCAAHKGSTTPLLLPDTAVNSLELVDTINKEADRVVLTANQVSLWAGMKLLRCPKPARKYLNCLSSHTP